MSIKADCHLHSSFSGDSKTPMEEMIISGIAKGLTTMCFTEHQDIDYPDSPDGPGSIFLLNTDSYLYELIRLREKYQEQIRILFGVELGLQKEILRKNAVYAKSYDFDFIIGSSHICHGKDPYYPAFFEGRSVTEAYREYFESILENVRSFSNFDVYGHLDYVVRDSPNMDRDYTCEPFADLFDEILKTLIVQNKGIEINSGGLRKGMQDFHPCTQILRRYRELGGEIITVGSDAHKAADIAADFESAADLLKECGFRYYTLFEKRVPEFHKL